MEKNMNVLKAAENLVTEFHKKRGDYDIKIGFSEEYSTKDIIAVEVFYKWKLDGWEKNVHKIDHVVKGTDGNWRVIEGLYTLEFSEHKTTV